MNSITSTSGRATEGARSVLEGLVVNKERGRVEIEFTDDHRKWMDVQQIHVCTILAVLLQFLES